MHNRVKLASVQPHGKTSDDTQLCTPQQQSYQSGQSACDSSALLPSFRSSVFPVNPRRLAGLFTPPVLTPESVSTSVAVEPTTPQPTLITSSMLGGASAWSAGAGVGLGFMGGAMPGSGFRQVDQGFGAVVQIADIKRNLYSRQLAAPKQLNASMLMSLLQSSFFPNSVQEQDVAVLKRLLGNYIKGADVGKLPAREVPPEVADQLLSQLPGADLIVARINPQLSGPDGLPDPGSTYNMAAIPAAVGPPGLQASLTAERFAAAVEDRQLRRLELSAMKDKHTLESTRESQHLFGLAKRMLDAERAYAASKKAAAEHNAAVSAYSREVEALGREIKEAEDKQQVAELEQRLQATQESLDKADLAYQQQLEAGVKALDELTALGDEETAEEGQDGCRRRTCGRAQESGACAVARRAAGGGLGNEAPPAAAHARCH